MPDTDKRAILDGTPEWFCKMYHTVADVQVITKHWLSEPDSSLLDLYEQLLLRTLTQLELRRKSDLEQAMKEATVTCGACGYMRAAPERPPLYTPVTHAEHGYGFIFTYEQCDDFSCGADFGQRGQWCVALRDLHIL